MTGSRHRVVPPLALPPIALTMGDPAGIGPEIALKAWAQRRASAVHAFYIIADADMMAARAKALGFDVPVHVITEPSEAANIFKTALPVIAIALAEPAVAGKPNAGNALATIASIDQAVGAVANGTASAVVTNPIAKSVLYQAGFAHPGHTEYLAALAARTWPASYHQPVMMLASDDLRVVPLTIHIPLHSVPPLITVDLITTTARITAAALRRDFGIHAPRIVVAGLNPHAGEDGSIGTEDRDVIAPAVAALAREGLSISGPHSADTLFHTSRRASYDAAICMYHDQALIPIKTLAFDDGVNVTLGLPFVRTSPDHGTAFDIAAEGSASPKSLIAALRLAASMAQRRAAFSS